MKHLLILLLLSVTTFGNLYAAAAASVSVTVATPAPDQLVAKSDSTTHQDLIAMAYKLVDTNPTTGQLYASQLFKEAYEQKDNEVLFVLAEWDIYQHKVGDQDLEQFRDKYSESFNYDEVMNKYTQTIQNGYCPDISDDHDLTVAVFVLNKDQEDKNSYTSEVKKFLLKNKEFRREENEKELAEKKRVEQEQREIQAEQEALREQKRIDNEQRAQRKAKAEAERAAVEERKKQKKQEREQQLADKQKKRDAAKAQHDAAQANNKQDSSGRMLTKREQKQAAAEQKKNHDLVVKQEREKLKKVTQKLFDTCMRFSQQERDLFSLEDVRLCTMDESLTSVEDIQKRIVKVQAAIGKYTAQWETKRKRDQEEQQRKDKAAQELERALLARQQNRQNGAQVSAAAAAAQACQADDWQSVRRKPKQPKAASRSVESDDNEVYISSMPLQETENEAEAALKAAQKASRIKASFEREVSADVSYAQAAGAKSAAAAPTVRAPTTTARAHTAAPVFVVPVIQHNNTDANSVQTSNSRQQRSVPAVPPAAQVARKNAADNKKTQQSRPQQPSSLTKNQLKKEKRKAARERFEQQKQEASHAIAAGSSSCAAPVPVAAYVAPAVQKTQKPTTPAQGQASSRVSSASKQAAARPAAIPAKTLTQQPKSSNEKVAQKQRDAELLKAARKADIEGMRVWLERGADVNASYRFVSNGNTPLMNLIRHFGINNKNPNKEALKKAVEFLCENGADATKKVSGKKKDRIKTAESLAQEYFNTTQDDTISKIIEREKNKNKAPDTGNQAVALAQVAASVHVKEAVADVSAARAAQPPALAPVNSQLRGAPVVPSMTAMKVPRARGSKTIQSLLAGIREEEREQVDLGPCITSLRAECIEEEKKLIEAASQGNLAEVKRLVEECQVNINAQHSDVQTGYTPLMAYIKGLIERKENRELQQITDATCVVNWMIENGADKTIKVGAITAQSLFEEYHDCDKGDGIHDSAVAQTASDDVVSNLSSAAAASAAACVVPKNTVLQGASDVSAVGIMNRRGAGQAIPIRLLRLLQEETSTRDRAQKTDQSKIADYNSSSEAPVPVSSVNSAAQERSGNAPAPAAAQVAKQDGATQKQSNVKKTEFFEAEREKNTRLIRAAARANLFGIKELLAQGAQVDARYPNYYSNSTPLTALLNAYNANTGCDKLKKPVKEKETWIEVIRYLRKHGASTDIPDKDGCTPLHFVRNLPDLEKVLKEDVTVVASSSSQEQTAQLAELSVASGVSRPAAAAAAAANPSDLAQRFKEDVAAAANNSSLEQPAQAAPTAGAQVASLAGLLVAGAATSAPAKPAQQQLVWNPRFIGYSAIL